jgi:predicted transcriptional regulator
MKKSILISIKPKYVADILNGRKTIEIRKTMPKCDLPIDVYIYCTKDKENLLDVGYKDFFSPRFIVRKDHKNYSLNGKVVAKFTLNKVERLHIKYGVGWNTNTIKDILTIEAKTCISRFALFDYLGSKGGYAWHIDNLVIFDEPKELSEFTNGKYIFGKNYKLELYKLTKAPQNYVFIETEE